MANVTFSSPRMPRDITVYAVAGDRGTLLSVAKRHKVPLPFDCQDGECGSCLVEVKHLGSCRYGIALTEKEKELLRELGKISPQEVMDAEVNDMPPRFRLACQYFVRHEDIFVSFPGDEAAPNKGPALSLAAAVYKGGLSIASLDEFLNYAVQVEHDAAQHFATLANAMEACGNAAVAELFGQLGHYSQMHLDEAKSKASRHDVAPELPPHTAWPDLHTPERTALWAGDPALSQLDALKAALQGERRGYEFYYAVAETTKDKAIRKVAKEFVREEIEHVETLKLWIERESAATASPQSVAR